MIFDPHRGADDDDASFDDRFKELLRQKKPGRTICRRQRLRPGDEDQGGPRRQPYAILAIFGGTYHRPVRDSDSGWFASFGENLSSYPFPSSFLVLQHHVGDDGSSSPSSIRRWPLAYVSSTENNAPETFQRACYGCLGIQEPSCRPRRGKPDGTFLQAWSPAGAQKVVESEVPAGRRREIERYLELFGYRPERTILQVHEAGSFGRGAPSKVELARRTTAAARYKGHTFTVVGRTHDTSLAERLASSPGEKRDSALVM